MCAPKSARVDPEPDRPHLKSGKVIFFWGRKKFKKKSYVLAKDPFDEVYKGDCLTLGG